jgi:hypothetical protein
MFTIVDIQTAYYMVAATGVLVAAVYYILNIQNSKKNQELMLKAQQQTLETRQAQLFMPIYATYHSEEYIKAFSEIMKWKYDSYDDYMAKYGLEVNPEAYLMYRKVFGYLEGIGVLVRRGLIDASLVDDLISGAVVSYWERFEPYLVERRKRLNWPQVGDR